LKQQEKLPEAVRIEDSLEILQLDLTRLTAKKNVFQEEEKMLVENLENAVRYIGNELLENAMKFQDEKTACAAKIFLSLYQEKIVFQIRNGCSVEQANNFQAFIEQKLLVGNPRQLYMEALRNSAKRGESAPSQVGLLSMICDYSAQLGWKFEPGDADSSSMVISTTVCLNIP
jgi:hypothetical protein